MNSFNRALTIPYIDARWPEDVGSTGKYTLRQCRSTKDGSLIAYEHKNMGRFTADNNQLMGPLSEKHASYLNEVTWPYLLFLVIWQ